MLITAKKVEPDQRACGSCDLLLIAFQFHNSVCSLRSIPVNVVSSLC